MHAVIGPSPQRSSSPCRLPPQIGEGGAKVRSWGSRVRFGFFLSSLLNKQHGFSYTKILKIAAENIKTENRKIFKKQFDQYGNDLNAHYFLPLINAMKRDFREKTNERFKNFQDLNRKADRFFLLKHSEKEDQKTLVFSLQQRVEKLFDSIKSFTTGSDGKE